MMAQGASGRPGADPDDDPLDGHPEPAPVGLQKPFWREQTGLTEGPARAAFFRASLPLLLSGVVAAACRYACFVVQSYYLGISGPASLSLYEMPLEVAARAPALSLARAVSVAAQQLLLAGREAEALAVFSQHAFLGVVVGGAVCLVGGAVSYWLADALDGFLGFGRFREFLIVSFVMEPLLQLFSRAAPPLLAAEGRVFFLFSLQVIHSFLDLGFTLCAYFLAQQMGWSTLAPTAAARALAMAGVTAWIVMAFSQRQVLGTQYHSLLRLPRRPERLGPRKGATGDALRRWAPEYLRAAAPAAGLLAISLCISLTYSGSARIMAARVYLYLYYLAYELLRELLSGFLQALRATAGLSVASRLYGRVVSSLAMCTLSVLLVGALVTALVLGFKSGILDTLLPSLSLTLSADSMASLAKSRGTVELAIVLGCLGAVWDGLGEILFVLLEIEARVGTSVFISLARFLGPLVCAVIAAVAVGEGEDYLKSIAFPEGAVGISSLLYLYYYAVKYKHLALVEEGRMAALSLEEQLRRV